jgi:hypothetical protein
MTPSRWALMGAVVLLVVAGCFAALVLLLGPQILPSGRAELRLLQADPVLAVRAPGATLRSQSAHPATRAWGLFGDTYTDTSIRQLFAFVGEPGEVVAFYGERARSVGWEPIFEGCSRAEQATALAFTRMMGDYKAGLAIRAQLAITPGTSKLERHLAVTMGPVNPRPVDAGFRRNDLHSLVGLDPSDPELIRPGTGAVTAEQLCRQLARVANVGTPSSDAPLIPGPATCILDARAVYMELEAADEPLAYYRDRSVGMDQSDGPFLYTFGPEDHLSRAWVPTSRGPLVLHARGVGPESVLRMAHALADVSSAVPDPRHTVDTSPCPRFAQC